MDISKTNRTLEQIIIDNQHNFGLEGSEYIIRVFQKRKDGIECYIRPSDRSGETINFIIKDNKILSTLKTEIIKEKINDILKDGK